MVKKIVLNLLKIFLTPFINKRKLSKIDNKIIASYSNDDFTTFFVKVRLWDAPFALLNKITPKIGKITDLGCGDGILTNYLALGSQNRKLTGIDVNKERVSRADKGLKNTRFIYKNVLKYSIPKSDVIIMTHLLHHLPNKSDQEKLINNGLKSLNKNGKLIITEVVEKPFTKHKISWLTDAFVVPVLFEKKLYDFNFHYRRDKQWQKLFDKLNLKYKVYYPHKNMPFSHVVYIVKK